MNEGLNQGQGDLINAQNIQTEVEGEESGKIIEKLHELPIMLIEKEGKKTFEDIQAKAPGKDICFCDGYIEGTESWERDGVGFKRENVLGIDHHMDLPEMSRNISTTNLAIKYVKKNGPVDKDSVVMITHTDCDSILSSAIMRGIIEPREEYGVAAIAADHTGEANPIGDLLQALETEMREDEQGEIREVEIRDIEFSLRNLELLLHGKELEPRAKAILETRYQKRENVLKLIESGMKTTESGKINYFDLDQKTDAGLFPAFMPSAHIALIFNPYKDKKDGLRKTEAKVRLGLGAPDGTDLRRIMENVDEKWGGRWDAGSNNRNGGDVKDKEVYAQKLEQVYQEYSQEK